jgi:hypothetical protein
MLLICVSRREARHGRMNQKLVVRTRHRELHRSDERSWWKFAGRFGPARKLWNKPRSVSHVRSLAKVDGGGSLTDLSYASGS